MIEVIGFALWAWGAYEGWKALTDQNNEWLNTMDPLNVIVKLAICIVLGLVFAVVKIFKIGVYIALWLVRTFL